MPELPEQKEGAQSNTVVSCTLASLEGAERVYRKAVASLRNVNEWKDMAGTGSAEFQLRDEQGAAVSRNVQEGDYFQINIPAPGNTTGEGYDWVQVERIGEEKEDQSVCFRIQVRPAPSPLNKNEDVAHFFSPEATSTFEIRRKDLTVQAGVFGRNEQPNTKVESIVDKARNTLIAGGAMGGMARLQWSKLVEGILERATQD